MCFDRFLMALSVMTDTADVLLMKKGVGSFCWRKISNRNSPIQERCRAASDAAMYSASDVDRATTVWRWLDHDMFPLFKQNTYPVTDRRVSWHWEKSASEYTFSGDDEPPNVIPKVLVPFKYRKTCLANCQCSLVQLALNRDSWDTPWDMSGLVEFDSHWRQPTTDWYGSVAASAISASDPLLRIVFGGNGVLDVLQFVIPKRSKTLSM